VGSTGVEGLVVVVGDGDGEVCVTQQAAHYCGGDGSAVQYFGSACQPVLIGDHGFVEQVGEADVGLDEWAGAVVAGVGKRTAFDDLDMGCGA